MKFLLLSIPSSGRPTSVVGTNLLYISYGEAIDSL